MIFIVFSLMIVLFPLTLILKFIFPKITNKTHVSNILCDTFLLIVTFLIFFRTHRYFKFIIIDFNGPYIIYLAIVSTIIISVQILTLRQMDSSTKIYRIILLAISALTYFEILMTLYVSVLP